MAREAQLEEENERLKKALQVLIPFVKEVQSWYGHGYGVANFHQNDELEPLDNFIVHATPEALEQALKVLEGEE